jgi:hypothetical protein
VHVGQEVRCVQSLPVRRLRFGEVYRVTGRCASSPEPVCRLTGRRQEEILLGAAELQRTCRPARLGTLYEQGNSHYAERPVLVVLNSKTRVTYWDPLYTTLTLGRVRNVTVVANRSTLDAAAQRLHDVLSAPLPDIPPVWQALVAALMAPVLEKKA